VVIDGCEVGCAKGVLEQAEVPLRGYLVITALGIDKNKEPLAKVIFCVAFLKK
jgi:uncharacterized metal-binding protein